MPGKGIVRSARRSVVASRVAWVSGALIVLSCSGASKFSSGDGDSGAGEPSVGGTSSGSAGEPSGGGTVATGGVAGTSPNGGRGGASTGGFGGTVAMGGTVSTGGDGGTSGASGSSTGGSENGGTAGSGGVAGQTGGVGGSAGSTSEDCPIQTPTGTCEPEALVCRYDNASRCLCTSTLPGTPCMRDSRCPLLLDRPARIILDAGVLDGGGAPIPTSTCTCRGGMWNCSFP